MGSGRSILVPSPDVHASSWLSSNGFASSSSIHSDGHTALHVAARLGDEWMCRYLLMQPDGEAQLLAFNKNGETPLKLALSYGHLTVCDLLFEACNDPSRPELASDGDIGCLGASMHGMSNGVPMRRKRPRAKPSNPTPKEANTLPQAVAPSMATQSESAEVENSATREAVGNPPRDASNGNSATPMPETSQTAPENPSDSRNGTDQAEAVRGSSAPTSMIPPSSNVEAKKSNDSVLKMSTRFTSHEIEQERYGYGGRNFRARGGIQVLHFPA